MLSVAYAQCHMQTIYTACHYAEYHYAECCYAEYHDAFLLHLGTKVLTYLCTRDISPIT
jgi:hypothetical protein